MITSIWLMGLALSGQVVTGNSSLPSDLILKASEKGPEEVLDLYRSQGFLMANINVNGDTVSVNEGPQFTIGRIELRGNEVYEDSDIISLFENGVFMESEVARSIDGIIRKYENSGYPFCAIEIDSLTLEADSVISWLHVIEGPFIRITRIQIEGNELTKDYVILRELRVEHGDMFCGDKIRDAIQRVRRLEFIDSAESDLCNTSELCIDVKERPTTRVDGVLGYGTPGFAGLIELEILNLFGTGRAVRSRWRKTDTVCTGLEMGYEEPWLLGYPVSLIASFSHRAELDYVRNRAELLFDVPITTSLAVSAGMSGTWVDSVSRYREIFGLDFDTRSVPGVHHRVKTEWDLYRIEEAMLNLDNTVGSVKSIVLFLSANFGVVLREEIEMYDKIRLGGASTLRGYWEEEFSGSRVAWSNVELRKFFGGESFIFPFYDIGYVDGELKQSYGGGVAAGSRIGLIKVVCGLAHPAELDQAKIHLSIEAVF
jgi:outer membrane protein assembly factor BamA